MNEEEKRSKRKIRDLNARQKRLLIQKSVTLLLAAIMVVLPIMMPIFTARPNSNSTLYKVSESVLSVAKDERPDLFEDVEIPEKVDMTIPSFVKTLSVLGSTIKIVQQFSDSDAPPSEKVDNFLNEIINSGNIQDIINAITFFGALGSGSVMQVITSVGMLLYMFFLILALILTFVIIIAVIYSFFKDNPTYQQVNQAVNQAANQEVKYNPKAWYAVFFAFCPYLFRIFNPQLEIGFGTQIITILGLVAILFNVIIVRIDVSNGIINFVQLVSLLGAVFAALFGYFLFQSDFIAALDLNLTKKTLGIGFSFLLNQDVPFEVYLSMVWVALFLISVALCVSTVKKNLSCLGCVLISGHSIPPRNLMRLIFGFIVYTVTPYTLELIDGTVLENYSRDEYILAGVFLGLTALTEIVFHKGIEIIQKYYIKKPGPSNDFAYYSDDFGFMFLLIRPIILFERPRQEEEEVTTGYIPEEWYEDDDSQTDA